MKTKGFIKYSTPTTRVDLIIIITSFVLSVIIFTKFDVNNGPAYSTGIGFFMMFLIKYIKFNKE